MSTVMVALILLGMMTLFIMLFMRFEKQKKQRHRNGLLSRFREIGTSNNLTFSSQEILAGGALGLDGPQRKLVLLTGSPETGNGQQVFCLDELSSCTVNKEYGGISEAAGRQRETYLEKLSLRFEFLNGRPPVELIFFHHFTGSIYQVKEMEEKATHWQATLSKMLSRPLMAAP